MMDRVFYLLYRNLSRGHFWLQRRVTVYGWVFLAFLALSAAMGLDTRASVIFQFFCLLFAIGGLAVLCCLRFRPALAVKRSLARVATAGAELHYTVTVENRGIRRQANLILFDTIPVVYPTFAEFRSWHDPAERQASRLERLLRMFKWQQLMRQKNSARLYRQECPDLLPGASRKVRLRAFPYQRGVLRFSSVIFARTDPFGLFRALHRVECPDTIIVLPKRYALPPLQLAGSRKYQPAGVALASSVGESQEFMSLRDYRPGDPPRIIHWRSWAKTGKPVVKEYQDEYFSRHALVLDTYLLAAGNRCFEESVSVAASLACTVATRESLLDLLFVDNKSYCFTAGRGVGHTTTLLEILAAVQPSRTGSFTALSRLVRERAGLISSAVFVLLHWDEQRRELVNLLEHRGIPVLVLVVGEDEQEDGAADVAGRGGAFHRLHPERMVEGLARI